MTLLRGGGWLLCSCRWISIMFVNLHLITEIYKGTRRYSAKSFHRVAVKLSGNAAGGSAGCYCYWVEMDWKRV